MIRQQSLGADGPSIGRLGYGAMVLEGFYGLTDDDHAIETIRCALDAGMTMIDSSDAYGNGHNEILIARATKGRKDAFVATKFGIVFDPAESGTEVPTGWNLSLRINGRPEYARRSLEASLSRLGVEALDLWYFHYPDPAVPIEETVGAMAAAVRAGKVRHIGLSNVTPEQLRRAHAVHPITAVQVEYSLWRREPETHLLPLMRELGIAMVPWAPLGTGFLTGTVNSLHPKDFRQRIPRFSESNLAVNTERFAPLLGLAGEFGITPAQLALAWLLHQGDDIFPIPGTRHPQRVFENAQASRIKFSPKQLEQIHQLTRPGLAQGATLV